MIGVGPHHNACSLEDGRGTMLRLAFAQGLPMLIHWDQHHTGEAIAQRRNGLRQRFLCP